MDFVFNGLDESTITMRVTDEVADGDPVKFINDQLVDSCTAGDNICGVVVNIRNGIAAVTVRGYAQLRYDTAKSAPGYGWQNIAAAGSGNAQVVTTGGRQMLVMNVNDKDATFDVLL